MIEDVCSGRSETSILIRRSFDQPACRARSRRGTRGRVNRGGGDVS